MRFYEKQRYGLILDLLTQLSDVEQQVVIQMEDPGLFVPDDLLDRWYTTFRGGQGLLNLGVSEDILEILLEFDYSLEQLVDILPTDAIDKVIFLRSDTIWQAVREMAEWTLQRVTDFSSPTHIEFGQN